MYLITIYTVGTRPHLSQPNAFPPCLLSTSIIPPQLRAVLQRLSLFTEPLYTSRFYTVHANLFHALLYIRDLTASRLAYTRD
jgi:hypothetical protein